MQLDNAADVDGVRRANVVANAQVAQGDIAQIVQRFVLNLRFKRASREREKRMEKGNSR